MSEKDTIEVIINRIPVEGMQLKGSLPAASFTLRDGDHFTIQNDLEYDLTANLVQQQLLITGSAKLKISCICDRCLGKFDLGVNVSDICHYIDDFKEDIVDISDHIREDILLTVPMKLICKEDCMGLCESCGQNLNIKGCSCEPLGPEPSVWDKLDGLDL